MQALAEKAASGDPDAMNAEGTKGKDRFGGDQAWQAPGETGLSPSSGDSFWGFILGIHPGDKSWADPDCGAWCSTLAGRGWSRPWRAGTKQAQSTAG